MSRPVPLTLVICDHVWRDPKSGKHSLLGTFSGIGSARFPFVTSFAVYFAVTDGQGSLPVRMELIDVDDERRAVFDVEGIFEFTDRREVVEGTLEFVNLAFPEPGEYRLKLFVAGEFLMERSLHVSAAQQGNATDG